MTDPKVESKSPLLDLSAKPRCAEVVYGGAVEVEVVLTNRGTSAAELSSFAGDSPLVYRFVRGEQTLLVDESTFRQALNPDEDPSPARATLMNLAPGAAEKRVDDAALFTLGQLTPGAWSLDARLYGPDVASKASPVNVRAAKPVFFVSARCPLTEKFFAAMVETAPRPAFHHRITPSSDPRPATFITTEVPASLTPPTSLAPALPASLDCLGHWFAATGGGLVLAAFTSGAPLRFLGTAKCSKDARLLATGAQLSDSARFLLLEGTQLRLVEAKANDTTLGAPIALPGAPTHESVQWAEGGLSAQVAFGISKPDASTVFVASTSGAGSVKIVLERALPLLALEVKARAERDGTGQLHAVFGPDPAGKLSVVVARFDGTVLAELEVDPGEPVGAVGVSAPGSGTPFVAWATPKGLVAARPPLLPTPVVDVVGTTRLSVYPTPGHGVFVEYLDPATGLRHAVVPSVGH